MKTKPFAFRYSVQSVGDSRKRLLREASEVNSRDRMTSSQHMNTKVNTEEGVEGSSRGETAAVPHVSDESYRATGIQSLGERDRASEAQCLDTDHW